MAERERARDGNRQFNTESLPSPAIVLHTSFTPLSFPVAETLGSIAWIAGRPGNVRKRRALQSIHRPGFTCVTVLLNLP